MDARTLIQTRRKEILETARRNGSVARGQDQPESDIDFLVNLEPGRSLMDLARLLRELNMLLDRPVDVGPEVGLRPRIKPQVLKEARPL